MKLITALCFPLFLSANTCMLPVYSLDELVQQSTSIFEGAIIAQHSFWDADRINILTANTIAVTQLVSLNNQETSTIQKVILITKGGQVNNDYMTFSGASHFQIGDSGLFFTQSSKHNITQKMDAPCFSLIQSQSNFLNQQTQSYTIAQKEYSPHQVYQKIQEISKKQFSFSPKSANLKYKKSLAAISNISPLNLPADGTQVIKIQGTSFGNLSGDASIYMPNCNYSNGVTYIEIPKNFISSWSNTLIQIKVPGFDIQTGFPGVGTGKVKVRTANGTEVTSTQTVTISYNHKKLESKNIDFISHNNDGDMPFYISKSLIDDGALPAIERAMDLWYCQTGIRFSIVGTVNEGCYKVDNKNVISYDDDCSISQLGFTRLLVSSCTSKNEPYLRDLDIIINRDKNWNFDLINSPNGSSDFASTILHELGHAHMLGHVLNKDDILFPIIQNTSTKKELTENNKMGGDKILSASKDQNGCSSYSPLTTFNEGFCCSPLNKLSVNYITSKSAVINFEHDLTNINTKVRFKKFGHANWELVSTDKTNIILGNLQACSSYQVQVSEACRNAEEVQFDEKTEVVFETNGCESCIHPGELFATGISNISAFLNWDVVPNRQYYEIQYRVDYTGKWKYYQTKYPFAVLFGLPACTAVQYRARIYCSDEVVSDFSHIKTLKTLCGAGKIDNEPDYPAFSLSPNPVKTQLTIHTNYREFSNTFFILKDTQGKLLQKERLSQNNFVLDLAPYPSGIYFLSFFNNGKQSIQKFVKE